MEHEEPLLHRNEDRKQRQIATGYDLDVASSKSRDLDGCPRSLTRGGNHELNRSSGPIKFPGYRNLTLARSKAHHDAYIASSGDGRGFYVAVPCLGKLGR